MKRDQKKQFVKNFKDILNNVGILVVTHYSGLKTTQTDELRLKIKEAGGKYIIVKNSLMKIILKEHKSKNDKLLILGGISGEKYLEQKDILEIATLPTLDEIRSKLICLIQTPARNIAYALKFSANKLARVFNEYSKLDIPEKKIENEAKSDEKSEIKVKAEEKPEVKANDKNNKGTEDK